MRRIRFTADTDRVRQGEAHLEGEVLECDDATADRWLRRLVAVDDENETAELELNRPTDGADGAEDAEQGVDDGDVDAASESDAGETASTEQSTASAASAQSTKPARAAAARAGRKPGK